MKSKGLVILSCFLLVSLLIAGTGLAANDSLNEWASSVKKSLNGTQITVAISSHPSTEAFMKMTKDFQKKTGINVRWNVIEESALYGRMLMELTAQSNRIDALMVCPEFLYGLTDLGAIEELNDYIAKAPSWFDWNDIVPAYRELLTGNNAEIFGIPFAGESGFLMYRKDLLEKYGKKVPATYDDVLELASFFNNKDIDGDGKPDLNGISFRGRRGWGMNWPWALVTFPFGGELVDPKTGAPRFNNPGTIEGLEFLVECAQYAPQGIESFGHYEAWTSFMMGKTAMLIESTAAAPMLEDTKKSLVAGKVGYAPMPQGPAGSYSGVWGWGMSMVSTVGQKQKDAVWALMTYMASREMQDVYLKNGGVVTRLSGYRLQEKEDLPYIPGVLEALEQAKALADKGYSVVPKIPEWMQVVELMGSYGSMAVAGQLTPEAAANLTQQTVVEVMKKK